jgi:hypothetical protein
LHIVTDEPQQDNPLSPSAVNAERPAHLREFAIPVIQNDEYTDGRPPWDWKSKYPPDPPDARTLINSESWILFSALVISLIVSGFLLSLATQSFDILIQGATSPPGDATTSNQALTIHIDCRLLMIFFVGCVGGTTFSIKWLIHSAAKGKWHLDRRYWRLFVPLLGGV